MKLQTIINRYLLASQFRQPRGFIGKKIGQGMARDNRDSNSWTLSLLDVQSDDHILEVGFGPGVTIKTLSRMVTDGFVAGIDFSKTMIQQAIKLNAAEINEGRVELKHADVSSIPYDDDSFDKVFAVSVVYFWSDILSIVSELKRIMKSGGTLALYMVSEELLDKSGLKQSPLYIINKVEDVTDVLNQAGFAKVWVETRTLPKGKVHCVLAR